MNFPSIEKNEQLAQILSGLSQEDRIIFLKKMGGVTYQKILLRVLEILSEDKKNTLERLIGEKSYSEESLLKFLKQEISNLEEIIAEESKKTANEFISLLN